MGNPPAENFPAIAVWWWKYVVTEPMIANETQESFQQK